jgi:NhaP-type Na+/H+ or K+/H+ antiporter
LPAISLDPELALVLFLPPLLMDGAYYTALGRFRRHLARHPVARGRRGVFTTLVVGVVVHWIIPALPWAACFALGAIVSPPDAVSARAVLKGVHLPRRLEACSKAKACSTTRRADPLPLRRRRDAQRVFHTGEALQSFAFVAIGGVIVGGLVAAGWIFLAKRLRDRMLIMLITILLCWAAYLAGEAVHVSGVIATVTAGLAMGWYQHEILSADVRLRANSGWQIMVFILEALVFILIGFSLRGAIERIGGIEAIPTSMVIVIAAVVITVTVARFVWIFASEAFLALARKLGLERARPLGWRQATVLSWAGMRGVVTLAVPLTLPIDMPGRDLMLICAFAVIFVTVVAQGSSLGASFAR